MHYPLGLQSRPSTGHCRTAPLPANRTIFQVAAAVGISLAAGLSSPAQALGFSGAYDPTNWTTSFGGGGDGSVDTSDAPNSITITGPDNNQANSYIDYTITAVGTGNVSFSWLYQTADINPNQDGFGYLLGGTFTMLTDDASLNPTGTSSFSVNSGDLFGYRVFSTDGKFGSGIATVYSFSAPDPTNSGPSQAEVPAPLPLFGAMGTYAWSRRLRRRIQAQRLHE